MCEREKQGDAKRETDKELERESLPWGLTCFTNERNFVLYSEDIRHYIHTLIYTQKHTQKTDTTKYESHSSDQSIKAVDADSSKNVA